MKLIFGIVVVVALALIAAACDGSTTTVSPEPSPTGPPLPATTGASPTPPEASPTREAPTAEAAPPLVLRSSAFEEGEEIPTRYTCNGGNVSPPLFWGAAPQGAASFVLIMDDPDAPSGIWDHWIVFNIPAHASGLAGSQPDTEELPTGGIHGENSWGNTEYGGPCPPPGPAHTYRFFLYAVDITLDLDPGASKTAVLQAIEGRIVAESLLSGTYGG